MPTCLKEEHKFVKFLLFDIIKFNHDGNKIGTCLRRAQIVKFLGVDIIKFNSDGKKIEIIVLNDLVIRITNILDLRAAYFQIYESTPELEAVKEKLEMYINIGEKKMVISSLMMLHDIVRL